MSVRIKKIKKRANLEKEVQLASVDQGIDIIEQPMTENGREVKRMIVITIGVEVTIIEQHSASPHLKVDDEYLT